MLCIGRLKAVKEIFKSTASTSLQLASVMIVPAVTPAEICIGSGKMSVPFSKPTRVVNGTEILCHNLSHSDLVLSVNDHAMSHANGRIIARPGFSNYREVSRKVVHGIVNEEQLSLIPTLLYPICSRKRGGNLGQYSAGEEITLGSVPVGFDLRTSPVPINDLSALRFRGEDKLQLKDTVKGGCVIEATFFPLLAVLLPKWLAKCDASKQKIVVIISGQGTPNDAKSSMGDNSTKFTGVLITKFIEREYPTIKVMHIHSATNIFRYDENIAFVKRELLPMIDSMRDDLAHLVGVRWKDLFKLTLSFADGSSARISAINAALKPYRPNYMHFWQLKTFWNETKVCEDDIECHSFEEIATDPAVKIDQTDSVVRLAVAETIRFKEEFEIIRGDQSIETDLSSFWLRKTKKPVLAVLLVQKPGQRPKLYRGTNMEVSMPTGSLCAERNVIGSALADDLTLRRQDLKVIVVYSAGSLGGSEGKAVGDGVPEGMNTGVGTGREGQGYFGSEGMLSNSSSCDKLCSAGSMTGPGSKHQRNMNNSQSSTYVTSSLNSTVKTEMESPTSSPRTRSKHLLSKSSPAESPLGASLGGIPGGVVTQQNNVGMSGEITAGNIEEEGSDKTIDSVKSLKMKSIGKSIVDFKTHSSENATPLPGTASTRSSFIGQTGRREDSVSLKHQDDLQAVPSTVPVNPSCADERWLITAGKRSYSVDSVWVMGGEDRDAEAPYSQGTGGSFSNLGVQGVTRSSFAPHTTGGRTADTNEGDGEKGFPISNGGGKVLPSPMGKKRDIMNIPITWPPREWGGAGSTGGDTAKSDIRIVDGSVGHGVKESTGSMTQATTPVPKRVTRPSSSSTSKKRPLEGPGSGPESSSGPSSARSARLTRRVANGAIVYPPSLVVWENGIDNNSSTSSSRRGSGVGSGSGSRPLLQRNACNLSDQASASKGCRTGCVDSAPADESIGERGYGTTSLSPLSCPPPGSDRVESDTAGWQGMQGTFPIGEVYECESDVPVAHTHSSHCIRAVTTITVDEADMNPLKPCGACTEWLKKIAEVNPSFKVVTFTDALCTGVYVEQINN